MTAWYVSEAIARGAAPAPKPEDRPAPERGIRYVEGHAELLFDPVELREVVSALEARRAVERGFVR